MKNKNNGLIGLVAVLVSALTIIIMAELRTDGYSHYHKAVSELGSLDAPNKWVFNLFGYILPGILISIFSYNLLKEFRSISIKSYPFYLFIFSGVFMCLAGVFPVDMTHEESLTSIIHAVGSLGSGICWIFCAFTLWWQLKKDKTWKTPAFLTLSVPFVMIFAMSFVPENRPGLSQRISFIGYYLFILILAGKQLLLTYRVKSPNVMGKYHKS